MMDEAFWVLIAFVILVMFLYRPGKTTVFAYLDSTIQFHATSLQEAAAFSKQNVDLLGIAQKKRSEAEDDTKKIITHAKNEAKRIEKLLHTQRGTLMHHAQSLVQKRYELGLKEIENQLYRDISQEAFKKITNN